MLSRRVAGLAAAAALAVTVSACGGTHEVGVPIAADPTPPTTTSAAPPPLATKTVPSTTTPVVAERVVVLDPGHNGGNATHTAQINEQVPAGRGRTKPCNTTGTATNAGYPEHAFTWDLALRVRDRLVAAGVKVVLTRQDNAGVGPCVDRRAAIGNEAGAAAVVSLHADGSTSDGARGFHIAYSSPPLNTAQGEPSRRLATTLRDGMAAAGFDTSTYVGENGLSARDDLGGLNLSTRPVALVECGNMRDAREAAVLSSPEGRQRYADAVANGVLGFLG
ncbi:MAG: N-acetylmuramoyl-L-alanine amidase [Actinomycetota bacterium]|nr:N-acetylmuramoyl-L-alanine amidase [Actinomycetota bacterium]